MHLEHREWGEGQLMFRMALSQGIHVMIVYASSYGGLVAEVAGGG